MRQNLMREASALLGEQVALWRTLNRTADAPAPVAEPVVAEPHFDLYPWQREALAAWRASGRRGVVQAVTGAGKTRVGVAAIHEALNEGRQALVITPTNELVKQWTRTIEELLPTARLWKKNGFGSWDVMVTTVHYAMSQPELLAPGGLIVADEAHRYGAASFSRALREGYKRRLGLSATYERGDFGDEILRRYFGTPCFDLGYERAVRDSLIAPFRFALVSVPLSAHERAEYTELTDAMSSSRLLLVQQHGLPDASPVDFLLAVSALANQQGYPLPDKVRTARRYMAKFSARKELLATTRMKYHVMAGLTPVITDANGAIVFTQTRASAEDVAEVLRSTGCTAAAIHSSLNDEQREERMEWLKQGEIQALSAPRILDEGVDVPDADLGVIVAANRSRRQLVQRLGRVLRRREGKTARFVVLYAEGTVEDPTAAGALPTFYDECLPWAEAVGRFDMAGKGQLEALLRFLGVDASEATRGESERIIREAGRDAAPTDAPQLDEDASAATSHGRSREKSDRMPLPVVGSASRFDGPAPVGLRPVTDDSIRDYLRGIGKIPLLSAEEETLLAKRIEAGLYAESLLTSADERFPVGSLERIAREGRWARDWFVASNLRLVVSIAKRYAGRGLDFLDLIQHGNHGLLRAVEKFDSARGHKFSTYATWWVTQAITRGLADEGATIRMPVHFVESLNKVNRERGLAGASWDQWVAAHPHGMPELEVSASDLKRMALLCRAHASVERLTEEFDDTWQRWAPACDNVAEHQAEAALTSQVEELLAGCELAHPREIAVLRYRHGLVTGEPMTLDEIGKIFGVTRERIRQLEKKALEYVWGEAELLKQLAQWDDEADQRKADEQRRLASFKKARKKVKPRRKRAEPTPAKSEDTFYIPRRGYMSDELWLDEDDESRPLPRRALGA